MEERARLSFACIVRIEHAGVLAFSEALIFATFLASSPRGVVLPFRLGGGGFGPDGLALGFAFGQELPSRSPLGSYLVWD